MTWSLSDEFLSKQRLLILAPHADDETYGCAGTIARVKNLGGEVYVIAFSVGDIVQYGETKKMVRGETRLDEFEIVMKYLKVDDHEVIFHESEKHLRLDVMPRRDLVDIIERSSRLSIENVKPTMLFLPAVSYNQDHEAIFRAGFTACRPHLREAKPFQYIVLAYDNTSLSWSVEREKFHPQLYIDISEFLEVKKKALSLHASQIRPSAFHGSIESVDYWARVRGREISVEAAEAYMCLRFVL